MFARGFYELREGIDLAHFFQQTEAETIAELRHRAAGTNCEPLLEGLSLNAVDINRSRNSASNQTPELYQPLAPQPFEHLSVIQTRFIDRLASVVGIKLAATDVLIDAPPPHREVEFNVPIYFPKEDVYRPLHQSCRWWNPSLKSSSTITWQAGAGLHASRPCFGRRSLRASVFAGSDRGSRRLSGLRAEAC